MASFPDSVIIVGAGIFGLSTALAIAARHPSCQVKIVDRLTPPVEDGTSVDTTRCIRSDYADPIYAKLSAESQKRIEQDPDLSRYYFKQGMSFVFDGEPGRFKDIWDKGLVNLKNAGCGPDELVETLSPEAVFRRIHGQDAQIAPDRALSGKRNWNKGYCNLHDAFIDAKESIRVFYERCLTKPSITFQCGVPVKKLCVENGRATGVVLEDGRQLTAGLTLVAAGAWSNRLVDLEGIMFSSAIEVAWIKLTDAEVAKWKNMSITTNLSTGFNLFPPHNGEIKILRRSAGYRNTVEIPHPEIAGKTLKTSLPRTTVTNPGDSIPLDAERALRDNLREIMPELADRPFDRTKLCWLAQTASADFIVAPHPRISGLHVATGGSAHAWKFLPVIGDLIIDSIQNKLDPVLAEKWAYRPKGSDGGSSPRMGGQPQELSLVVRSRL